MAETKTAVVALFLISLLVAASSLPAVAAYGCYDDCYERCGNGKQDAACATMCTEACVVGAAKDIATKAKDLAGKAGEAVSMNSNN